jgi:CheY-like chemotaxis protein
MYEQILLVDDEPLFLTSLIPFLEDAGHQVLSAPSAELALVALRQNRPDAIICDLRMPGIDGFEFYRTVRQNPEWQTIPFVFLTGDMLEASLEPGPDLECTWILRKPFDVEDLLTILMDERNS